MSALCHPSPSRIGCFGATCPRTVRVVAPVRSTVCASYKNGENVDLSRLPDYMRHEDDTGSTESQVARLSARVQQITAHLKANRKDFAAKRGLEQVLAQRKSLLQYLYRKDRDSYDRMVGDFKVRNVVSVDTRGAAREKAEELAL